MKIKLTLLLLLFSMEVFSNINYIEFQKIPNYESYVDKFDFLIENEGYYNHWTPDWNYDVSKKKLEKVLKECFEIFSAVESEDINKYLLLGDISHYLYNLQNEKFYEIAVTNYKNAMDINPHDCRPYWFIGNHYALSNVPEKSIDMFIKAQEFLPENEPVGFWEEFTFATAVANMPSHSIYAMEKTKSILGEEGFFEQQLGKSIRNRIISVNKDSSYNFMNIWSASEGDLITFTSRPLGLKLLVDSTWQINFYDYKNHQSVVTMVPPAIKNESGREITYSIALIIKTASNNGNLSEFIKNFISRYPEKDIIDFSTKYSEMLSYEVKDPKMYEDMGGAHMNMIGIKRIAPQYPGLLLEKPITVPSGKSKKLTFYKASDSKDRFEGEIFYAIMLDTCEDIYEESYRNFKDFFENQIVIE